MVSTLHPWIHFCPQAGRQHTYPPPPPAPFLGALPARTNRRTLTCSASAGPTRCPPPPPTSACRAGLLGRWRDATVGPPSLSPGRRGHGVPRHKVGIRRPILAADNTPLLLLPPLHPHLIPGNCQGPQHWPLCQGSLLEGPQRRVLRAGGAHYTLSYCWGSGKTPLFVISLIFIENVMVGSKQ